MSEQQVCRRGIDGSPGCGHDAAFSNLTPPGVCKVIVAEDYDGPVYCAHICDFSPAADEAGDAPARCPVCGHQPHRPSGCLNMASDNDCNCKHGSLPAALPTRSGAQRLPGRDTDWDAYESEQTERQVRSYQALGVNLTTLQTAAADVAHWNRMYRELAWENAREAVAASRGAQSRPSAEDKPPARVRVCVRQGKDDWIGVAYTSQPCNPDTIREYVAADPIRRALEACERNCVTYDRSINIRNEDWEALRDAVNGRL